METLDLKAMTNKELLILARAIVDELYMKTDENDAEMLKRLEAHSNELTRRIIKMNRHGER